MKIYTRTGDQGQTSILKGKRLSKSDALVNVLGSLDELNASLGVITAEISLQYYINLIVCIQSELFYAGSILADLSAPLKSYKYFDGSTIELEQEINKLTAKLPELRNFILPGGTSEAATVHLCRAICRRSERDLVSYIKKTNSKKILAFEKYLNRLSDFLFVFARYLNYKKNRKDIIWKG